MTGLRDFLEGADLETGEVGSPQPRPAPAGAGPGVQNFIEGGELMPRVVNQAPTEGLGSLQRKAREEEVTKTGAGGNSDFFLNDSQGRGIPGTENNITAASLAGMDNPAIGKVISNELRTTLVGTGSVLGTAAAVESGPVGMAGGAALGAAGGEAVTQVIEDAARAMGIPGVNPSLSAFGRLQSAFNEGVLDLGFTAGATALGPVLRYGARGLLKYVGGVTQEGFDFAKAAHQQGINLAAVNVSDSVATSFYKKVFGRFPILGGGAIRKTVVEQGKEVKKAVGNIAEFLRRSDSMNMAALGVDMHKAADKRFDGFIDMYNRRFKEIYTLARDAGSTVDAELLKNQAKAALGALKEKSSVSAKLMDSDQAKWLQSIEELPDRITLDELDGLKSTLMGHLSESKGATQRLMGDMRLAAEETMGTIDDKVVLKQLDELNGLIHNQMREIFETPTAQKFRRVDKSFGNKRGPRFEKQGTRNPDETMNFIWNMDSPKAMGDLRKLIGPNLYKKAVASKLQSTFDEAFAIGEEATRTGRTEEGIIAGVDIKKLRETFGLFNKSSARYQTTKTMMSEAGMDMKRLETLIDSVEAVARAAPGDMNAFVARRVTLGGMGAVRGALLPGSTAMAGTVMSASTGLSVLSFWLTARGFGRIISSPDLMKRAIGAMDDSAGFMVRKRNLMVMARLMGVDSGAVSADMEGIPEALDKLKKLKDPMDKLDAFVDQKLEGAR